MMKISTLKKRMRLRRCLKWVCFWVGLFVKTRRVQSLIITVPVSETSVRKDPGSVVVDVVVGAIFLGAILVRMTSRDVGMI